jgi:signal transduction histidine kinase
MTLTRLKWTSIGAALGFIALLDLVRRQLEPFFPSWQGEALMGAAVFLGCLFFFGALFMVLDRQQGKLERRTRELMALNAAMSDVYGELALDAVLQKVVDQACQLIDARYGALSVVDGTGRIESFVTSGISAEVRQRIGEPPIGRGLLGVPLREGQKLCMKDIAQDPRSVGFPASHPVMHSLLAVPIVCKGPFRGNLYLSERSDGTDFTKEDEESLGRFAIAAAIAIDSAYLHEQLQSLAVAEERLRISHDIHDGVAQVLAYLNTKTQAIKELLAGGRFDDASAQLEKLAATAREEYAQMREALIGLRAAAVPGRTLADILHEYSDRWQDAHAIECRLRILRLPSLQPQTELQVLRIIQEALANVRKHSHARSAEVTIEAAGSTLRIAIEDDGAGFNPADLGRSEFPRFGLATMRERAESLGGKLRLDSTPGKGTWVSIEIPLKPAAHYVA